MLALMGSGLKIPFPTDTKKKGTLIKLLGIKLSNIGVMGCSLLSIQARCLRCKCAVDVKLPMGETVAGACGKCSISYQCLFRPVLFHSGITKVGFVDCEGE